jgi:hypothetical protein
LSKNPPFPPFEKGGNRKSPFVKGDLEGFSSSQHDFDVTLDETNLTEPRFYGLDCKTESELWEPNSEGERSKMKGVRFLTDPF